MYDIQGYTNCTIIILYPSIWIKVYDNIMLDEDNSIKKEIIYYQATST